MARLDRTRERSPHRPPRVTGPSAERYLAVAADLARRGGTDAWAHLTSQIPLSGLADELGVARTTLYRHWPTRHDFWLDLTAYLAFGNDFAQPTPGLPWNQQLDPLDTIDPSDGDPLEVVRTTMNALQDVVLGDVWVLVRAAQLAYAEMPELARTRALVEQDRLEQLTRQIVERMQTHSIAVAAPSTARDVAVTMWCIGDGLGVLNRYLPEVASQQILFDGGSGPRPWGLFGFTYRALLLGTTERLGEAAGVVRTTPDGSPESVPDAAVPSVTERWSERQRQVLEAGTAMLLERLVTEVPDARLDVLGHVTVNRIARAAGVSRRAVYDVWPSRDDLVLDLLGSLLDDDVDELVDAFVASATTRVPSRGSPTLGQWVDEVLFGGYRSPGASPGPGRAGAGGATDGDLQQAVLVALPHAHLAPVTAILRARHERLVDSLVDHVETIVCAGGARLRAGVTTAQLTLLVLTLVDGARRVLRSNPTAVRPPGPTSRSTFGTAADVLVSASLDR